MVVEVIDAPWAGVPARLRWFKWRWICREHACQTVIFLEHDERMCAPRARLGARVIRWAIRQFRFEGATIAGLARQLATTWNSVWSHIEPCLRAASDDSARFAGVRVLGVDEHVWHHQDRRGRGPRELTGIVDHSRGGASHGPLEWTWSRVGLAPCMRTGWPSAANSFAPVSFAPVSRSRRWIPSRDSKNAIAWPAPRTQPACAAPFISSSSLVTLQVRCVVASSKTRPVTAGARVIPSTQVRNLLRASRHRLTPRQQERLCEAFTADEAHVSVDVAYLHRASVRGLPPSHTHPRPTLAAHLIERLPACPILEIARLGANPAQVEGRTRRLLRHRRSQQRLHGSHQRTLSSWADESPEATATPPATNSECSSSQEA